MSRLAPLRVRRRVPPENGEALPATLHPVLRRLYAARGVTSAEELDHGLARLLPHHDLGGVEEAAALLEEAIGRGEPITVVGDYDADGATGTALLLRGLRALGAARVGYLVPSRLRDGYGLGPSVVEALRSGGEAPALLVTVDNGIAALEGVRAARAAGMRVVVTDHHLPGARLPEADALVNPRLPGDRFPSKALAGVGVAFYLLAALRARMRAAGRLPAGGGPRLAALLDLVALGTVADLVSLDANNRVLVEQGLARIRAGRACPGITALLEVAGRDPRRAVSADLAFAAGPRLNAAGRIAEMGLGIECLLADEREQALALARRLDALNRERRAIEARMRDQAALELERLRLDGALPAGLALFDPGWHQGVVGILAARVREQVHRPVVAFAPLGDGRLRGSARSVPGVHVRDAIERVASAAPGLVERFGGHAMAAGLTLAAGRLEEFQAAFAEVIGELLEGVEDPAVLITDGELEPEHHEIGLAEALRAGGPWGQGFPEPLFDGAFELLARRVVGERHLRLRLALPGRRAPLEAIAFGAAGGEQDPGGAARLRAAYRLAVDEYRGGRSVQLLIERIGA